MLILTRRIGETIMIGDDVRITLLDIRGNQARIGIDAPAEIKVHREEIYNRIQQQLHADNDGTLPEVDGNTVAATDTAKTPVITVRQRSRLWNSDRAALQA